MTKIAHDFDWCLSAIVTDRQTYRNVGRNQSSFRTAERFNNYDPDRREASVSWSEVHYGSAGS
jgi:hypothetical protein